MFFKFLKRHWWAIVFSLCLTGFTVYLALDTFVISRVYTVVTPYTRATTDSEDTANDAASEDSAATEESSSDPGDDSSETDSDDTDSGHGHHGHGRHRKRSHDASDKDSDTDTGDSADASESATESASDSSSSTASETTSTTYSDDSVSITLTEYRENDTTIYVADVTVSSYDNLLTAFAENAYGKNITQKTSEIAENANAILAINGDFYGAQEKGYVIRNGVLYRDTAASGQEDLAIYKDGSFGIISESDITASELIDAGAWQVLSFGPALVADGTVSVSSSDEVGKAMASNPRTALGITEDGHYLFVVSDGRTDVSEGLSLYELAEFMQSLGATTAYNLDGGGSSTMYFNGEVVNQPTTSGDSIKERSVSDIVYIGS